MELSQILDQSQPRVSRHLKLLTEAGPGRTFPGRRLGLLPADRRRPAPRGCWTRRWAASRRTTPLLSRDAERLEQVRRERSDAAAAYFARNAARWDELRTLYVEEADVEAAVLDAVGPGPFRRLVDLGSGTGRMLTLLADRVGERHRPGSVAADAEHRPHATPPRPGSTGCELRHGDIFETRLAAGCADLVVVHQVLHYLSDPAAAVAEAARLVAPGGRLLIVDFAPHGLEFLREAHQHRRLGFSDAEMGRWFEAAGLAAQPPRRPAAGQGQGADGEDLDRRARQPSATGAPHERRRPPDPPPLAPSPAPASARPTTPAAQRLSFEFSPPRTPEAGGEPVGRDPPAGAAGPGLRLGHLRRRRLDPRAHPPHRAPHPGRDHAEAGRAPDLRRRLAAAEVDEVIRDYWDAGIRHHRGPARRSARRARRRLPAARRRLRQRHRTDRRHRPHRPVRDRRSASIRRSIRKARRSRTTSTC